MCIHKKIFKQMITVQKNRFGSINFWITIIVFILLLSNIVFAATIEKEIQFFVGAKAFIADGVTQQMDVAPFIGSDNRVQVPVRYLALAIGITENNIIWDAINSTVTLKNDTTTVQFKIGSNIILINEQPRTMDTVPIIKDNRTFLPARYVAEAFGFEVSWLEGPQIVRITKSTAESTLETVQKLSAKEIALQNNESIVYIITYDSKGNPLSQGSGFIATSDGKVVTNWHVIKGASQITVYLSNEQSYNLSDLNSYDSDRDIAILQLPVKNVRACTLGNSDTVVAGDEVTVISNPQGFAYSVTTGVISAVDRIIDEKKWLQFSAPVSPGSSGGPIFNDQGEVIGIVTQGFKPELAQNLNFAIPINEVKPFLKNEGSIPLSSLSKEKEQLSYNDFATFIKKEYGIIKTGPYTLAFNIVNVEELNNGTLTISLIIDSISDLKWLSAEINGYKGDIERWLLSILSEAENEYPEKQIIVAVWLIDYYNFYPSAWPAKFISLQPDGRWLLVYPKVAADNLNGYQKVTWRPME